MRLGTVGVAAYKKMQISETPSCDGETKNHTVIARPTCRRHAVESGTGTKNHRTVGRGPAGGAAGKEV